jgi:hypothetical protein
MPIQNNFWKSLLGQNAEIFIGKGVQYTDDATYALFVANAVEGEIGVFKTADNTAFNGAGAAAATDEVFIALKRDGLVERSVPFVVGNTKKTRTIYEAPVKQVSTVSSGATRATLTLQTLTFTAKAFGVLGNGVTVAYVDSASNNVPLSIAVVGSAITVNLATDGASAPTSTGDQVKAALEASPDAMNLLSSVVVSGNGATVITAAAATNLTGGTTQTAVAGDIVGLKVLETTPGFQPFPTYEWSVTAKLGETWDALLTRLVDQINSTTSKANRDRDLIVTASYSASNDAITVTAKDFGVTFRIQLQNKLYTSGEVVYTTNAKIGSGFPAQVRILQTHGDVYKGVTTQYPLQGANPADFGAPTDFVSDALGYNIYVISGNRSEASKSPHKVQNYPHTILIAVPSTGASAEEEVKAIFAL